MSIPDFDPEAEGAICRFDLQFVLRTGENSLFLKALSDLWTLAMYKLRKANGLCLSESGPVLFSSDQAVDVLATLSATDETMKMAMFQEPFGFGQSGAIERAFAKVFGDGLYTKWLITFEDGQFDQCLALIEAGSELLVQAKNGRGRSKDTIAPGNDPCPPRDKEH